MRVVGRVLVLQSLLGAAILRATVDFGRGRRSSSGGAVL